MSLFDAYRFDGRRVLVVGGATGMGAAAAELALDAGDRNGALTFFGATCCTSLRKAARGACALKWKRWMFSSFTSTCGRPVPNCNVSPGSACKSA